MALFSSSSATAKLTKPKKGSVEKFLGGREFKNYDTYKAHLESIGLTARPKGNWYGLDGYWLESERKNAWLGWRNAVHYITRHKFRDYLLPFGQILAYYKQIYFFIEKRKHETRWLNGAYYLVEDLWEAYEDDIKSGKIWFTKDLEPLLKDLNKAIANFAITQFYRLLFGEYKDNPRKGEEAYKFDSDFILAEQRDIAFPAYTKYDKPVGESNILKKMSGVYNNSSWIARIKSFDISGISIPVFPGYYQSNLAKASERFGQDSRIQVPIAMLYPNKYFLIDERFSAPFRALESFNPAFRNALLKGQKDYKAFITVHVDDSSTESKIFEAYVETNSIVMKIFKK